MCVYVRAHTVCVCTCKADWAGKGLRDYCRQGCDLRKVVMKTICRSEWRESERERVNEREAKRASKCGEKREAERQAPQKPCSFLSYAASLWTLEDCDVPQGSHCILTYLALTPSALPRSEEVVFRSVDRFNESIRGRRVTRCKIQAFSSLTLWG